MNMPSSKNESSHSDKILPLLSATLIASTLMTMQPPAAQAWWFPFAHKHDGKQHTKRQRQLAGSPVGLVPGNPPAMYWAAEGKPKAAVLCLHELGLYNGVFDDLGRRMSKKGLAVYAIDLRGFGGWSDIGGPDSKMDLDKTLADVKGSVEIMHKLHPDVPVFILGEAMGGALALKAASTFPELISGVITAAPGGDHFETSKNYTTVAQKMVTVGPNGDSDYGEDLMQIATPKEELREAFRTDPKVRMDLAPRELMACQFFMYKTKDMARKIKSTPVLVVHGANDGESKEKGSQKVYDSLTTKDKAYLKISNGDHYTFEDVHVPDEAFDGTLSWIERKLPAPAQPQG